MNDQSIKSIAVTISIIIFSIVSGFSKNMHGALFWILPGNVDAISNPDNIIYVKLLFSLFEGMKLGFWITLFENILYRVSASKFLGTWIYKSDAGNYGIAKFYISGFLSGSTKIRYSVDLHYPQTIIDAVNKRGQSHPFGTAEDLVTKFSGNELLLVYKVDAGKTENEGKPYDAKKGILTIKPSDDSSVMTGIWESTKINDGTIPDKNIRYGDLKFYRKKRFTAYSDRIMA